MATSLLPVPQVLTLLAEATSRVAELTADLSPVQLRTPPEVGEWSLTDILAHLRSCADLWGDCIATILAHDNPTIRATNPQAWIERTDYRDLEFQPSFEVFIRQRTELLSVLRPLPTASWERQATVTGAGKPLIRTVHSYAARLAIHERSHYREIKRLVTVLRIRRQQP